jgi:hypothetical protein
MIREDRLLNRNSFFREYFINYSPSRFRAVRRFHSNTFRSHTSAPQPVHLVALLESARLHRQQLLRLDMMLSKAPITNSDAPMTNMATARASSVFQ